MPAGRPLKFKTVEELDKKIEAYFEQATVPTITGLAVFLETSRETLSDYKDKPQYSDSIKRALARCEQFVNEGALTGKLNATMAIFNLKNNYGWKDKQEQDITSNGESVAPVMVKFIGDNEQPKDNN